MLSTIGSIASSSGQMRLSLLKTLSVAAGSAYTGDNYLLLNGAGGQLYKVDNGAFTQIALPTGVPGGCLSNDGNYLVFTKDYVMYVYSRSGDTFSLLCNPTNQNTNGSFGYMHFNAKNTHYVYISSSRYPKVSRKVGNTFPDEPSILPAFTYDYPYSHYGLSYSSDGAYLISFGNNEPSIVAWRATGDTYTRLSIPVPPRDMCSRYVDISYDGTYIVGENGVSGSPYVVVYKRSGDVFNLLCYLTDITNYINGVKFSNDGKYVVLRTADIPFTTYKLYVYERQGDTFTLIQIISEPSSGTGTAYDNTLVFTSDSRYLISVLYGKHVNIYITY